MSTDAGRHDTPLSSDGADDGTGSEEDRLELEHEAGRTRPARERMRDKFSHASDGFFSALRSERNLRVHCIIAVLALLLCFFLKVSLSGWISILICIGLVLFAELFNTAIETVVDLASPEFHPLAKRAKDIAAAAVLVLASLSIIVGLAIYIDAFTRLVG